MTQPHRNTLVAELLVTVMVVLTTPPLSAARSVSQFGITWSFERDYPTGQFANGDHWVVGPITITSITPRSSTSAGVTMHGSMINPKPNTPQGFDSRLQQNPFAASANVARNFPLTVKAGSSLVSTISNPKKTKNKDPQLRTAAILTVLAEAPPAGSFRPPYAGSDKSIRWNQQDLDYDVLRSLPRPRSAPSLSAVARSFERPLIELRSNWAGNFLKPALNSPGYGREMSHTVADGLLSLNLNYSRAEKEKTLVGLVQWGIDIYGAAAHGMTWGNDWGHNHGRKPVLLLAGAVLHDPNILAYGDARKHFIFQEDHQTWYVGLVDVGRRLKTSDGRKRLPYTLDMIGQPEWGGKHVGEPAADASNWDATYRTVCGSSMVGTVLAARLMKLESKWNWPALFDYIDRYYQMEGHRPGTSTNQVQPFVAEMWNAYRGSTPGDFSTANTSTDEVWQSVSIPTQTRPFTVTFDMVASNPAMEGVTGLSAKAAGKAIDLAAMVRFAPSGLVEAFNGTTYAAANALRYRAGIRYRVTMMVDLAARRYSVNVAPPGAAAVRIADNWAFRNVQKAVSTLTHVSFTSTGGSHSVLDVGITPQANGADTGKAPSSTPRSAQASAPSKPPSGATRSSTASNTIRINAGGPRYVDKAGKVWAADKGFAGGLKSSSTAPIAGTNDDKLYQTERYENARSSATARYRLALANGNYRVRLHFAETFAANFAPKKRVFDVKLENQTVVSQLDVFARVGSNRSLVIEVPATVNDKFLDLSFGRRKQNPTLSGIEIIPTS